MEYTRAMEFDPSQAPVCNYNRGGLLPFEPVRPGVGGRGRGEKTRLSEQRAVHRSASRGAEEIGRSPTRSGRVRVKNDAVNCRCNLRSPASPAACTLRAHQGRSPPAPPRSAAHLQVQLQELPQQIAPLRKAVRRPRCPIQFRVRVLQRIGAWQFQRPVERPQPAPQIFQRRRPHPPNLTARARHRLYQPRPGKPAARKRVKTDSGVYRNCSVNFEHFVTNHNQCADDCKIPKL